MEVFNFKKSKITAQQLVEFLLVAPFLIIILGVITEYAYALNVNLTLSQGIKTVSASVYEEIRPGMDKNATDTLVLAKLKEYMRRNNAPVREENNLRVNSILVGNNAVFLASYKYITAFTLPSTYFRILPDEFNFWGAALVPAAFLSPNTYPDISSAQLDKIWASTADFSSLDSFNDSKNGIMKESLSSSTSDTNSMVFFLKIETPPSYGPDFISALDDVYAVYNWQGPYAGMYADASNNHLYKCDSSSCQDLGAGIINKLSGFNFFCFYYDFIKNDLDEVKTDWYKGTNPLYIKETDGILKTAIALFDASNSNNGNLDNLDVGKYNIEASVGRSYIKDNLGSKVIIHKNGDNIENLFAGQTPSSLSGILGSRVYKK